MIIHYNLILIIKIYLYYIFIIIMYGNILILIHLFIIYLFTLILLFCNNKKILKFLFILLIFQTLLFIINNGCIITKLEKILTKNKNTIIDPLLDIINIKKNNKNRYHLTIIYMGFLWLILLLKIYIFL
jgi:hypothetical protein